MANEFDEQRGTVCKKKIRRWCANDSTIDNKQQSAELGQTVAHDFLLLLLIDCFSYFAFDNQINENFQNNDWINVWHEGMEALLSDYFVKEKTKKASSWASWTFREGIPLNNFDNSNFLLKLWMIV